MQIHNKRDNKTMLDQDLVDLVKEKSCNHSLKELCQRHSALVVSMATRLSKKYNNWAITQEIIDDKEYIIYSSAKKYKQNKNTKFSTFLGNETQCAFLNKCNQLKKRSRHLTLMSDFIDKLNFNPQYVNNNDNLDHLLNLLSIKKDKRMLKIFELRYKVGFENKVMPWHLVAKRVGLSAQGCINIHRSGIAFLKEKLKKEGAYA